MTDTQTYNGWTNYETWCVNLWLTNESGTEAELQRVVHDRPINSMVGDIDVSTSMKADLLKDWVRDQMPDLGANMYSDLLSASLDLVNWREIIENHLDDE